MTSHFDSTDDDSHSDGVPVVMRGTITKVCFRLTHSLKLMADMPSNKDSAVLNCTKLSDASATKSLVLSIKVV